jgi:hypothetical protein
VRPRKPDVVIEVVEVVEVVGESVPADEQAASTMAVATTAIPDRLVKMRIVPNMISATYQSPGETCKHSINKSPSDWGQ